MAFRSSSTGIAASSSVGVTAPAGVSANDILIMAVETFGNTVTWPSGFSATFASWTCAGSSHGRLSFWAAAWKLATGSETTLTVSCAGSGEIKAVCTCNSGRSATPGTPVATNSTGNGVTPFAVTLPTTGYTPTAGDDVIVFVGLGDTNTAGTWAITNSSGLTVRQDLNANGTFTGGEINLSTIDNISSIGANLNFTATGTSLVATSGGDTAGVVIPLSLFGTPTNTATIAWVT